MSIRNIYILIGVLLYGTSCSEFLDVKPDQKISTITTSDDLLALMSNSSIMNTGYSGLSEIAADNYYLTAADWESLGLIEYRGSYLWEKIPMHNAHWNSQYTRILYANIVLDEIDNVEVGPSGMEKDHIKGMAYFFRAYTLMSLMEIFCPSFHTDDAGEKLGLVLKDNSNINENKGRSSLLETFRFIESDLTEAVRLLPTAAFEYPTRPYKAAALGALARLYLSVADYEQAEKFADEALFYRSVTLDYALIEDGGLYPFEQYNEDIIFFSSYSAQNILLMGRAKVEESLHESFSDEDYRKALFFSLNDDQTISFTGNYQSLIASELFNGITVAELLLIKSEAAARRNDVQTAASTLVKLLGKRYKEIPALPVEAEALLSRILDERRKELIFRGTRWSDLKRYSHAEDFELVRMLADGIYKLRSEELRNFCFYIPQSVIDRGNVVQNR